MQGAVKQVGEQTGHQVERVVVGGSLLLSCARAKVDMDIGIG